ncbi:hypothetical protein CC86DRAFT_458129 [Ophiobolus disseminans]|uniref:GPI anchored protein n=1 Tax=Ophiobolus disseminans TaxID=1469910 RepID=A0A6A6ZRX5_9PLEO|nr:hypothetical protein CC86DRAFT_458129 [Ophiobolus disseminans]
MHYFDLSHACVLLLAAVLSQGVVATPLNDLPTHRILRAATKREDLYRRSLRIRKTFKSELAYTEEENGWNGKTTFASQVRVNSQKPIVNLEEIEHFLQDVQCESGKIRMSFVDDSSARDAYHSCHGDDGGLIITSHDSCNNEGERAVYKVHEVSFADELGESLELSVTEASWQDAFDHLDISFGHTADDHLFRRHSDFAKIRKRQSIGNIPAIDIPADTPDNVNAITFDLKSELIDKTFAAGDFLLGLDQLVPLPPVPIEFGCNNCSTRGQIALTQGAFKIDVGQIDIIPDILEGGDDGKEITDIITGGFIELAATGVGARLDLFARPKVNGAFEIALFPIPILGFVIPGIGKAGAVFEPRIAFDFEVSGGFEINYGIDVALPDKSNIRLELTDIGESKANLLPGSTLSPLPFSVDVADVDVLLGLAFKPTITVGFEFSDKLTAEVFVSVNLPRLDAKLSTDAPANCGNSTNATTPAAPFANSTGSIIGDIAALGPLVLVEANISITVDVGIGLNLPFLPDPFGNVSVEANIFSVGFPLVTACVNPNDTFPSMTATVTALPTPCNVTATTVVYRTEKVTQTSVVRATKPWSNHTVASTVIEKTPLVPGVTHIWTPPVQVTSTANATTTLVARAEDTTTVVPTLAPISFQAGPTILVSSGFLAPGNATLTPAQQNNSVFTGAAVPGAVVQWQSVGWQLVVIGVGMGFGAM